MTIQHVKGSVVGILQGSNIVLDDQGNPVIIPQGVIVRRIALRGENIEGPADLTAGIESNPNLFIAASDGLSTTMLLEDQLFTPTGFVSATDNSYELRLFSSNVLSNSIVRMALEYTTFDSY